MTTKLVWEQLRDHREADPEHQRLSKAHRELRDLQSTLQSGLTAGTFKLQRQLVARDAVMHFASETSCTDSGQDSQLEQLTATHGEAWCSMFHQAADDLTELILEQCEALVAQRKERDDVKARAAFAYAEMQACADRLDAEYKEKHAGTTGPAA